MTTKQQVVFKDRVVHVGDKVLVDQTMLIRTLMEISPEFNMNTILNPYYYPNWNSWGCLDYLKNNKQEEVQKILHECADDSEEENRRLLQLVHENPPMVRLWGIYWVDEELADKLLEKGEAMFRNRLGSWWISGVVVDDDCEEGQLDAKAIASVFEEALA